MAARLKLGDTEIGTIFDLLDLIRMRPGMWIGEPSITRLAIFVEGFRSGVLAAHASFDAETPPFQGFHDWVAARLGRQKNGHGWCDMILDSTGGNDQAAFEKLWTELDAFREG